jgi:hypothetical protein
MHQKEIQLDRQARPRRGGKDDRCHCQELLRLGDQFLEAALLINDPLVGPLPDAPACVLDGGAKLARVVVGVRLAGLELRVAQDVVHDGEAREALGRLAGPVAPDAAGGGGERLGRAGGEGESGGEVGDGDAGGALGGRDEVWLEEGHGERRVARGPGEAFRCEGGQAELEAVPQLDHGVDGARQQANEEVLPGLGEEVALDGREHAGGLDARGEEGEVGGVGVRLAEQLVKVGLGDGALKWRQRPLVAGVGLVDGLKKLRRGTEGVRREDMVRQMVMETVVVESPVELEVVLVQESSACVLDQQHQGSPPYSWAVFAEA